MTPWSKQKPLSLQRSRDNIWLGTEELASKQPSNLSRKSAFSLTSVPQQKSSDEFESHQSSQIQLPAKTSGINKKSSMRLRDETITEEDESKFQGVNSSHIALGHPTGETIVIQLAEVTIRPLKMIKKVNESKQQHNFSMNQQAQPETRQNQPASKTTSKVEASSAAYTKSQEIPQCQSIDDCELCTKNHSLKNSSKAKANFWPPSSTDQRNLVIKTSSRGKIQKIASPKKSSRSTVAISARVTKLSSETREYFEEKLMFLNSISLKS